MPRPSPIPEHQWASVIDRYQAGESIHGLANELGLNRSTIQRRITRAGVSLRPVSTACSSHAFPIDHDAFENAHLSEHPSYWCGFMATDGCVSVRKHTTYIKITLSAADRNHVDKFRLFVGATDHKITVSHPKKTAINGVPVLAGEMATIMVASKKMANDLAGYGVVPRKTMSLETPPSINNRHFWRGAVDGDGTVGLRSKRGNQDPYLIFGCGSRRFVDQFADYARRHTDSQASVYWSGFVWATTLSGHGAVQLIDNLYAGSTISLDRKMAKAESVLSFWPIPPSERFPDRYAIRRRKAELYVESCRLPSGDTV